MDIAYQDIVISPSENDNAFSKILIAKAPGLYPTAYVSSNRLYIRFRNFEITLNPPPDSSSTGSIYFSGFDGIAESTDSQTIFTGIKVEWFGVNNSGDYTYDFDPFEYSDHFEIGPFPSDTYNFHVSPLWVYAEAISPQMAVDIMDVVIPE